MVSTIKRTRWGANKSDWKFFSKSLELCEDLLPTVSNINAEIDPNSTITQLGKTPSLYNKNGYAVGMAKWTKHTTTLNEVARWAMQPDYGICVQTRNVRAIDIDIEDEKVAKHIETFIEEHLELKIPLRYRENSGKRLLAICVEGVFPKRVLKTDDGAIEFLATGQQFVAVGMHQSGAPYKWDWKGEKEFPTISRDDWEMIIFLLLQETCGDLIGRDHLPKPTTEINVPQVDETADFLIENGLVLADGPRGQLHIECPFEDEHTTESSISSTSYFPKGTGGYEQGHFVCLHGHCEGRTDREFIDKLGVYISHFNDVELSEEELAECPPNYRNRDKAGRPKATLDNCILALERPDICGVEIIHDKFLEQVILRSPNKHSSRLLRDVDYVKLRRTLEREQGFYPVGHDMIKHAVLYVATKNQIDSMREWVTSQKWDGVPRVENFLHNYFGGPDTAYGRAVGMYLWTALAGRAVDPGVKADMAVIIQGLQGELKSTAVAALAPTQEMFTELQLGMDEDKTARALLGKCIVELPELKGLRTGQIEHIKADIVKQVDRYRKLYQETITEYKRRCLFFGTTNDTEILIDTTGNRRWLPYEVEGKIDIETIRRDLKQLWAEGAVMYRNSGVAWQGAEQLARDEHEKFRVRDVWEEMIWDYWMREANEDDLLGGELSAQERGYVTSREVLEDALGVSTKKNNQMRAANCLKNIGFESEDRWINGGSKRIWVYIGKTQTK